MPNRFSFVVPFHRGLGWLAQCLSALNPLPPGSEIIVVADGAEESCARVAAEHGARVIALEGPAGPAVARNAGAAAATGDVLVFVDADVVVVPGGIAHVQRVFDEQPHTTAVFGSYDDHPGDAGFMSQYKNLSHSFIHHSSETRARTFWTGFGAVRREAFDAVGGFDERLRSVEDIDLGYRLTAEGYEVRLDTRLSACHLKRWTLRSTVMSDVLDRGIPWTQLIWRYGALTDDLNLRSEYRWSIGLAYAALALAVAAFVDARFGLAIPPLFAGLTALNQRYYGFFYRKRGAAFAARVWLVHLLQHFYNGVSFTVGSTLYFAARHLNLRLPGSLAAVPWSECRRQPRPTTSPAVWSVDPVR